MEALGQRIDRRATIEMVDSVDENLVKLTKDYHKLCESSNGTVRLANKLKETVDGLKENFSDLEEKFDNNEPSEEWGTWFDSRASQLLLLVWVSYSDSTEGRRILSLLRLAAMFARFVHHTAL